MKICKGREAVFFSIDVKPQIQNEQTFFPHNILWIFGSMLKLVGLSNVQKSRFSPYEIWLPIDFWQKLSTVKMTAFIYCWPSLFKISFQNIREKSTKKMNNKILYFHYIISMVFKRSKIKIQSLWNMITHWFLAKVIYS
jgi:hypothetical protein